MFPTKKKCEVGVGVNCVHQSESDYVCMILYRYVYIPYMCIRLHTYIYYETISKNNGGGGNHGGYGTIKSVDKDGKVLEVLYDGR